MAISPYLISVVIVQLNSVLGGPSGTNSGVLGCYGVALVLFAVLVLVVVFLGGVYV